MDVKPEEDDGDEVVQELDVYLCKNLSKNLYLLQYPTLPNAKKYTTDQRFNARVKPKHNKLEMEVLLDVNNPNYNQSKGEQIAINVDGASGNSSENMTFENSVMDTQVLTSSRVPQTGKHFAAAVVSNGQVHLTPVAEIMQMRPGFKYMDRAEKRAVQAAQLKAQAESGNSSQDETEDAKAVTVRFKGVETEASRMARERSYAVYEKSLFEEKWVSTSIFPQSHISSANSRKKMVYFAHNDQGFMDCGASEATEMTLSAGDYLKTMIPSYSTNVSESAPISHNVLSLASLFSLSLPDQLKAVMRNVKIIHFSHLLTLLPDNPDANIVVRSLQSYAVLVRGCWIVKSEVLYPPKTLSPVTGICCENVCRARDYILCCFCQKQYLVRKEIVKKVNIPSDEIKEIFEHIAVLKPKAGWHLRLEPDNQFQIRFPEAHERQMMVWATRYKQLCQQLNLPQEGEIGKANHTSKPPTQQTDKPGKHHKKQGKTTVTHKQSSCVVKQEKHLPNGEAFNTKPSIPPQISKDTVMVKNEVDAMDCDSASLPPFVIPQSVGITTVSGNDSMEPSGLLPMTELLTSNQSPKQMYEDIVLSTKDSSKINMDNVNSTVALVANEMRLQNNYPISLMDTSDQMLSTTQNANL